MSLEQHAMADIDEIAESEEDWGKRRENMRHEVSIPAEAIDPVYGSYRCEIEDVSSTGMALKLEHIAIEPGQEPLKQGARAAIKFPPDPVNAPESKVEVPVTVMWRTPVAFGVRFIEINQALRSALQAIAQAAVQERTSAAGNRRTLSKEQRAIMLECRKTVQRLLPNLIWVLRSEITRMLRAKAEEFGDARAAPLLADADLVDEKAAAIGRTIEHQFLQGFAEASDLDETQELTMGHLAGTLGGANTGGKAQLTEDEVIEESSHIASLAHMAEERYKSKYFELDVRLANVIEHPLDREVNPLAPATSCRILWKAIVTYSDSKAVQAAMQQAMQKRVVPLLGELYEELHKTLDASGAQRIFDI